MTAPGPWLAAGGQIRAVPWQKSFADCLAHGGSVGHVSAAGLSPTPADRMGTVPLWVCCTSVPFLQVPHPSPELFTPEDSMGSYAAHLIHKDSLCQGRRLSPHTISPPSPSPSLTPNSPLGPDPHIQLCFDLVEIQQWDLPHRFVAF